MHGCTIVNDKKSHVQHTDSLRPRESNQTHKKLGFSILKGEVTLGCQC